MIFAKSAEPTLKMANILIGSLKGKGNWTIKVPDSWH